MPFIRKLTSGYTKNKKYDGYHGLDKTDQFDDFKSKYLQAVNNSESEAVYNNGVKTKYNADMFPEAFRKNKQGKTASDLFADRLTAAENLDPDIAALYSNIGDLPNLPNGYKISYTGTNHSLSVTRSYTGQILECKLSIPKMQGDDLNGQHNIAFHEMGHFIDLGCGQTHNAMTKASQKLTAAVTASGSTMSGEINDVITNFQTQHKVISVEIGNKYKSHRNTLSDNYRAGRITYKEYSRLWNASFREQELEIDYRARNLLGGGIDSLSDIYDALSGGTYMDSGKLLYGHGVKYYSKPGKQNSEIFANYLSLSVNRPDLIAMLRSDKPGLCDALDETIKEMAGKLP